MLKAMEANRSESTPPMKLEKHGAGQIYPAGSFPKNFMNRANTMFSNKIGLSTFFPSFKDC